AGDVHAYREPSSYTASVPIPSRSGSNERAPIADDAYGAGHTARPSSSSTTAASTMSSSSTPRSRNPSHTAGSNVGASYAARTAAIGARSRRNARTDARNISCSSENSKSIGGRSYRVAVSVREAVLPDDADAIAALDTSFTTATIYVVTFVDDRFDVTPTAVDPPGTKTFPIDGLTGWRAWERAWVATDDDNRIVGVCAVRDERWNARLVIWHLYVDRGARGHGHGRALLQHALADGTERGAQFAWLETSKLDYQ